ncbi:MAG TPA: DUF4440 domain-containing protein [Kofleriaceae bacterium]|jgi:ketosteroid isomerase-like protein
MSNFKQFLETKRREAASAYVVGDASNVIAISAKSGPATFFDPGGKLTSGANEINEANEKGASHFGPKSRTTLEILESGESGDLGYWVGYQDAEMDIEGKLQHMKLRITEVFKRVGGEWHMVHRHADMAKE